MFDNTMKEILTHDRKCENEKCKENRWNELKVVDVEYIGFTEDEVKKLKKRNFQKKKWWHNIFW